MSSRLLPVLAALTALAAVYSNGPVPAGPPITAHALPTASTTAARWVKPMFVPPIALSGRPTVREPRNVFADEGAGTLAPGVDEDRPLVYVPHNRSGDVWEIDPASYQVVAKYPAGREMQHVVPSYDMRTLRPLNSMSAPSVADTIAGADSRTA